MKKIKRRIQQFLAKLTKVQITIVVLLLLSTSVAYGAYKVAELNYNDQLMRYDNSSKNEIDKDTAMGKAMKAYLDGVPATQNGREYPGFLEPEPNSSFAQFYPYMDETEDGAEAEFFLIYVHSNTARRNNTRYSTIGYTIHRLNDPTSDAYDDYVNGNGTSSKQLVGESYYIKEGNYRESVFVPGAVYYQHNTTIEGTNDKLLETFGNSTISAEGRVYQHGRKATKDKNCVVTVAFIPISSFLDAVIDTDYSGFVLDKTSFTSFCVNDGLNPGTYAHTDWKNEIIKALSAGKDYYVGISPVYTWINGRNEVQGYINDNYVAEVNSSNHHEVNGVTTTGDCWYYRNYEDAEAVLRRQGFRQTDGKVEAYENIKADMNKVLRLPFGDAPASYHVVYVDVDDPDKVIDKNPSKYTHVNKGETIKANRNKVFDYKGTMYTLCTNAEEWGQYKPIVVGADGVTGQEFLKSATYQQAYDKRKDEYYSGHNVNVTDKGEKVRLESNSAIKRTYNVLYIPVKSTSEVNVINYFDANTGMVIHQEESVEFKKGERLNISIGINDTIQTEDGQVYRIAEEADWGTRAPYLYGCEGKYKWIYERWSYDEIQAKFEGDSEYKRRTVNVNKNDLLGVYEYTTDIKCTTKNNALYVPVVCQTEEFTPITVKYFNTETKKDVKTTTSHLTAAGKVDYDQLGNHILGDDGATYEIVYLSEEELNAGNDYGSNQPYAFTLDKPVPNNYYKSAKSNYKATRKKVFVTQTMISVSPTQMVEQYNYYTKKAMDEGESVVLYIPVQPIESDPIEPEVSNGQIIKGPLERANVKSSESGVTNAAPLIVTYNDTNEFDVGTAIPTTQKFTNSVELDEWYGEVTISSDQWNDTVSVKVSVDYTWGYNLWDVLYYNYYSSTDKDGKTTYWSSPVYGWKYYGTYNGNVTRTYTYDYGYSERGPVTWNYISTLNVYQLDKATIENGCFNGAKEYNVDAVIPFRMVQNPWTGNGVNMKTVTQTGGSVASLNKGNYKTHVEYPKIKKNLTGNAGHFVSYGDSSASQQGYDAALSLGVSLFEQETAGKYLTGHSDTLTLNGVTLCNESSGLQVSTPYVYADQINKQQSIVTIPQHTENKMYSTKLTAKYEKIIVSPTIRTIVLDDRGEDGVDESGDENKRAIKDGFKDNEAIAVHSPVIAPISIPDRETQTQLSDYALNNGVAQLLPDKHYTIQWDWDNLFEREQDYMKGYGVAVEAGWTNAFKRYVQKKEIRFPFPVKVNGRYYELTTSERSKSGRHTVSFTDWIEIPESQYVEFDIYIPTWAKTGIYDESYGATSRFDWTEAGIQTRVWANNSLIEFYENNPESDPRLVEGYEYNLDRTMYVGTYSYPVQISPIVYGFEVITTNDEVAYGEDITDADDKFSLVASGQERKVGLSNRFGDEFVRKTNGEEVTNAWNPNYTLPFVTGKSEYLAMGNFSLGQSFNFSLQTISGLVDGNNDYFVVTPTFRYVDRDGTVTEQDNLRIYYNNGDEEFIEIGSEYDNLSNARLDAQLADIDYQEAFCRYYYQDCSYMVGALGTQCGYHSNYPMITSELTGKSIHDCVFPKIQLGTLSKLTLPQEMMLFSGDEKELYDNRVLNGSNLFRYNSYPNNYGTITTQAKDSFLGSMQKWFGEYRIPEEFMVLKKYDSYGNKYSLYDEYDQNGNYITESYFHKNTVMMSDLEELMETDGYLVLNFRIDLYIDGHLYAHYYSDNANRIDMWQREKGSLSNVVNTYSGVWVPDQTTGDVLPLGGYTTVYGRSGDIAIISMSDNLKNRKESGLLWIQ